MSERYVLAIDQGTTGTTALLVDLTNPLAPEVCSRATVDFKQYYPKAGWVEHDLDEIWLTVKQSIQKSLSLAQSKIKNFSVKNVVAIGLTNQRETLCTFDRKTGAPLCHAIVWQCRRSASICKHLKEAKQLEFVNQRTGLVLDPYFSGTKMTWLLEQNPEVSAAVKNKTAVFGTIDTYLLHRLSAGAAYATEPSNASRTLLFDIEKGEFTTELAQLFSLPHLDCLPEVKDSAGIFGKTRSLDFLPDGIPISGILGDQQAALAGQTCFAPGEAKCTYGTGAFLLLNTGAERRHSHTGLLATVAWSLKGKMTYALEGSCFIAGAAVQFLRDQLNFVDSAAVTEAMAQEEVGAPEVYFVPALAGLGAPQWNPEARGAFFGLTRGTNKGQLVRATLEGIAFQVNDLVDVMKKDFAGDMTVLRVDGGAAANGLLMQTQADLCRMEVDRPLNLETTAFGAALFAGLGVGIYSDFNQMRNARKADKVFSAAKDKDSDSKRSEALAGWRRAVKAVEVFANHD